MRIRLTGSWRLAQRPDGQLRTSARTAICFLAKTFNAIHMLD
jgi:hypothetical protein